MFSSFRLPLSIYFQNKEAAESGSHMQHNKRNLKIRDHFMNSRINFDWRFNYHHLSFISRGKSHRKKSNFFFHH